VKKGMEEDTRVLGMSKRGGIEGGGTKIRKEVDEKIQKKRENRKTSVNQCKIRKRLEIRN